jgi:CRP/FNR family transcriptional regulator, cyclic AMP receptor protein
METHSLESILREHPFFQGLAPAYLELIVGCASNVKFAPKELVGKHNDPADRFFIIRSGKMALEVDVPGRGPFIIQTLGDGDVIGWSWLFPPYTWNFDMRSVEATRAIALDAKCLRKKCDEDHDMGYEMMKRFSAIMLDRLKATRLQILDLYGTTGPAAPAGR